MGEVTELRRPPMNLRCPQCGGEWWSTRGIVLSADGEHVVGWVTPLTCVDCGHVKP